MRIFSSFHPDYGSTTELLSFGRRLTQLAVERPDAPATSLVASDGSRDGVTFRELHRWSNAVAAALASEGVGASSTVVVGLGNSLEHMATIFGAWKLGALVLPMSTKAPAPERDAMLALAAPRVVVSSWGDVAGISAAYVSDLRAGADLTPPDVVPHPGKSVGSGGSTGRPKIIVNPNPLAKVPGRTAGTVGDLVGFHAARVQAVPGPVYHNMPLTWSMHGVFEGQHVILLERFSAVQLLEVIERDRVEFMTVVPTMMRRVAELPNASSYDLSSLRGVLHSAAPCPPTIKRFWIDLVGPDVLWEGFGGAESVGQTLIDGNEWLAHPGSVGRPYETDLRIVGEDGRDLGPGEVGEVYMRPQAGSSADRHRYLGSEPARTTDDGFVSLGDLGWQDEEGYLYCADRRLDMIITGGSNVYPAEVEAALLDHPSVSDAAVIGLPDEEWGKRVHAVVEAYAGRPAPDPDELITWCRNALSAYKVPKAVEVVSALPRDEAGKIRRRALVDAREGA